jgi:AhpD family alkylhydroperoxidase
MPFVQTPPDHRFPWYVRLFFWNQRRRYGAVLEPARLWGRSPKVFAVLALLYGALDRRSSPLEPTLRSLVTVRVSQINWCAFCVDINSATVLKRGVDEAKLAELSQFETSGRFSTLLGAREGRPRLCGSRYVLGPTHDARTLRLTESAFRRRRDRRAYRAHCVSEPLEQVQRSARGCTPRVLYGGAAAGNGIRRFDPASAKVSPEGSVVTRKIERSPSLNTPRFLWGYLWGYFAPFRLYLFILKAVKRTLHQSFIK